MRVPFIMGPRRRGARVGSWQGRKECPYQQIRARLRTPPGAVQRGPAAQCFIVEGALKSRHDNRDTLRAFGPAPAAPGCGGDAVRPGPVGDARFDAARPGSEAAAGRTDRLEVSEHVVSLDDVRGHSSAVLEGAGRPGDRDIVRGQGRSRRRRRGSRDGHGFRACGAATAPRRLPACEGGTRSHGQNRTEDGQRSPQCRTAVPKNVSAKVAPSQAAGAPARRLALTTSVRVDRGPTASEPRNRSILTFRSGQGRPDAAIFAPTEVTRILRDHGFRIRRTSGNRLPGSRPST